MLLEAGSAESPRLDVLAVEDDEAMRSLLRLHLSNAGYSVILAPDAIVAGYHILKSRPDLIILDVNLPYIDGLEFAATLQADTTLPHIPIIFITANEDFGPRAEQLGADFIVKPFLKERLLESVARNIGLPCRKHALPSPPLAAVGAAVR